MNPEFVTLEKTLDLLNSLVALDRDAIEMLVEYRVRCNEALAGHPTVQVGHAIGEPGNVDKPYRVGLLGILNGLIGVQTSGVGFIAALYSSKCPKCGWSDEHEAKSHDFGTPCPKCGESLEQGRLIRFVKFGSKE